MDKLSVAIVSFARFFSLPLKPELLAAIRQQTLVQPSTAAVQPDAVKQATTEPGADSGTIAKNREALSLAAAAAESKGVELHPKGLEEFAEAIDPDWQRRQDTEGRHQRGRQDRNHDEQQEHTPTKTGPITAAGLARMALESAKKDPLLVILNRLPGKNGQYWMVFPFNFCEGEREFNVSMRVLLETEHNALNRTNCIVDRMVLDIAESSRAESTRTQRPETLRRWLFVLEAANGPVRKPPANEPPVYRLGVYLQPELPSKALASFTRELSALMGIDPQRIFVKNRPESFPVESGGGDDLLGSVNEVV